MLRQKNMDIQVQYPGLIEAMIEVESACDVNAVGDLGLKHKAYGCLQIRQPYMSDALGKHRKAQECLGNMKLSIEVMNAYMTRYASERRLGRPATAEDIARMHNGGPNGYKMEATEGYWEKVKKIYKT